MHLPSWLRSLALILSALILILIVLFVSAPLPVSIFGFNTSEDNKYICARMIAIAVSTLAGMFSKILYEEINRGPDKQFNIMNSFKGMLTGKPFWLAVLLSPIVIGYLFKQFEEISNVFSVSFLAYQNGFFFNAIISRIASGIKNEIPN